MILVAKQLGEKCTGLPLGRPPLLLAGQALHPWLRPLQYGILRLGEGRNECIDFNCVSPYVRVNSFSQQLCKNLLLSIAFTTLFKFIYANVFLLL
jgi:hypothetical protein